jgi:hypothetical protein
MRALILLALAPVAFTQQHDILIQRTAAAQGVQVFTSTSTPVKGAPYMAEAVTETVQRLADGTRITNNTTTKLYRDSEGRTRTDATLKALGPWVPEGTGAGRSISTIFDPITNESFTLHHDTRTANRANLKSLPPPAATAIRGEHSARPVRVDVEKRVLIGGPGEAHAGDLLMPGPQAIQWVREGPGPGGAIAMGSVMMPEKLDLQTKSLGKRMIEGVECEGTLLTGIIAEGQIGNDRPIEIITEIWRSSALKIDVIRKHVDPRFGETNYRLINLVRAEQPRTLFELPSGYELKELPATFNIKVDPPKQPR